MADLLIELVSEEIPARMQTMAATHFAAAVETALDDLGLWSKKFRFSIKYAKSYRNMD